MTQLFAGKSRIRSGPLTARGLLCRAQSGFVGGIVFAMVALALAPVQARGGSAVARDGEKISLDFQGVPLATVLELLKQDAQIEVSVPPSALPKLVTVKARKLPVDKALARLFKSASLKNYAIVHGADSKDWIYVVATEGVNSSAISQAPAARTFSQAPAAQTRSQSPDAQTFSQMPTAGMYSPAPPAQTFSQAPATVAFALPPDAQNPDALAPANFPQAQAPFVPAPSPQMAGAPEEPTSGGNSDFIQTDAGPVQRLQGYGLPGH